MTDQTDRDFRARIEIKQVLENYFHALDACDADLLASVFAPECEVRYHVGTPGEFVQNGHSSVVGYLVRNMANYRVRSHATSNTRVTLQGDGSASSVTHAIAILWKADKVHVRGLRYEDALKLAGGEWRVVRRRHSPLWQFDADPVDPVVPKPALELARSQA